MQISRFIIVAMLSITCTRAVAGDLVAGELGEPIDMSSFYDMDSVIE